MTRMLRVWISGGFSVMVLAFILVLGVSTASAVAVDFECLNETTFAIQVGPTIGSGIGSVCYVALDIGNADLAGYKTNYAVGTITLTSSTTADVHFNTEKTFSPNGDPLGDTLGRPDYSLGGAHTLRRPLSSSIFRTLVHVASRPTVGGLAAL